MMTEGAGKLKVFLCILAGIILLHVLVIGLVIRSNGPKAPGKASKEEKKTAKTAASVLKKAPEKPKPVHRYRKVSAAPGFGKPFDFSGARRGTFPARLVPGDQSTAAILVDMDSRKVLWEKNSSQMVPIASMSKMMTILLTMEHLERNPSWSLYTVVPISKAVLDLPQREGIIWLDPREKLPLGDLLKCAAIKSANDAALQLALVVAGNEKKFVALMNQKARQIGMKNTRFINAHGLPDKQKQHSLSSTADMVMLGERLLEYPQIMRYFATPFASIKRGDKRTDINNTNKLILKSYSSAEGMKTGFTRKAGFCLTFSVLRNGRRIMGCVTGFPSSRARDHFCRDLIDWAFAGCPDKPLPKKFAKSVKRKKAVRAARPAQNRKNTKN